MQKRIEVQTFDDPAWGMSSKAKMKSGQDEPNRHYLAAGLGCGLGAKISTVAAPATTTINPA